MNLKAGTASHRDGWVFAFAPADDDSTATDGRCVIAPEACAAQASQAGRIAREAGDILAEAMRAAGRLRLRLGHRPDPLLLAPAAPVSTLISRIQLVDIQHIGR